MRLEELVEALSLYRLAGFALDAGEFRMGDLRRRPEHDCKDSMCRATIRNKAPGPRHLGGREYPWMGDDE